MIHIRDISKTFGSFTALDRISLDITSGELVALLGPSGSGKTTLLRIIAGLESADSGTISFSGIEATTLTVREREVGFVFQHYALFRHMTVAENISFGLRVRPRSQRPSRDEINGRVRELLSLVQLNGLGERYPNQLSGGQRQRVALARALAIDPKILLLDEPFGALDARVRKELRRWLRRLQDELKITGIFVTHDQEEALEVADRVVVMNNGTIEQIGTPSEIYDRPDTPFVYQFLGNVNRLDCIAHDGILEVGDMGNMSGKQSQLMRIPLPEGAPATGKGAVFLRPHNIRLVSDNHSGLNAVVRHLSILGPKVRVELDHSGLALEMEMDRRLFSQTPLVQGQTIRFTPHEARLFIDGWQCDLNFPLQKQEITPAS